MEGYDNHNVCVCVCVCVLPLDLRGYRLSLSRSVFSGWNMIYENPELKDFFYQCNAKKTNF